MDSNQSNDKRVSSSTGGLDRYLDVILILSLMLATWPPATRSSSVAQPIMKSFIIAELAQYCPLGALQQIRRDLHLWFAVQSAL